MDELLREFLTETSESLATLDVELVKLEQDPNAPDLIDNIFRLVHTIKGTCGFLGLPRLEAVAHSAENVLGTALPLLLKRSPRTKIVMSSTLTTQNADIALQALALGASDYIAKPTASSDLHAADGFRRQLIDKIRALGNSSRMRGNTATRVVAKSQAGEVVNTRPTGGHYGSPSCCVNRVD